MGVTIGIRREDKNEWERRVPLTPADVADLARDHDLHFLVQPSPIRVFGDAEFAAAGAELVEDLAPADVVLAVKEIPVAELLEKRVYLYFSHTSKGQYYNMPMLQHLLDVGATLIDYERIADEQNRRLVFFSLHAGYAGTIETLLALGQRLAERGLVTPLLEIRPAYRYADLAEALAHLRSLGQRIADEGLGAWTEPLIVGLAGYGNVAKGCRVILDCLRAREIPVSGLEAAARGSAAEVGPLAFVVFKEEDMVVPRSADAQFVLQDYYQRPANYRSVFESHLARLDVLMNCIFWTPAYPRLVTRKWVKANYGPGKSPRLKVIGDISCDLEGGVEVTLKTTSPDAPCFVYEAESGAALDGVKGNGPVIMAVDNLPCELPRESSEHFGSVLRGMIPALAQADFAMDFEGLHLPSHLKKAVITHRGELPPKFRYLQEHLDRAGK